CGIVGNARFLDERVQRVEVGGDEIVRALRRHRHHRRGAGLGGGKKSGDQGFERIRALRRGRLVGGEGRTGDERRNQRQRREALARSKSFGGHGATCSVQRGRSERTPDPISDSSTKRDNFSGRRLAGRLRQRRVTAP